MYVEIGYGERDAAEGRELVVAIDVLRACTTICALLHHVTERILLVDAPDTALELRGCKKNWIAIGERGGKPLPGFDIGNSPSEVESLEHSYSAAVMTTSNGTRTVLAARRASNVLCAGFVNLGATLSAITRMQPKEVLLLASGNRKSECVADNLCAEVLRERLQGHSRDLNDVRRLILRSPAGKRFCSSDESGFPCSDLEIALDADRYDFAVRISHRTDSCCTLEPYLHKSTREKGRTC